MKDIEREDLIEIASRRRCIVCRRPYGRKGVRILGRRDEAWLVAVTCDYCQAQGLMVATLDSEEETINLTRRTDTRPKVMYDVSYEEWLAFQEMPPISEDDVLDMHLFLKDFDGDFKKLFGKDADTEDSSA
jgi:hypothetical protein